MKTIIVFCFTLLQFLSSVSADEIKKDIAMSLNVVGNGSTTVTGSPLFNGTARASSGAELTVSARPLEQFPKVIFAGRVGVGEEHKHEVWFTGSSLGTKKCDTPVSGMLGLDLAPDSSAISVRVLGGIKHYLNCDGKYALGGASFTQSDMSNTVPTAEIQISGNLGDINPRISDNLKQVSIGAYIRTSGNMTSSATPVAGTTIQNKTGDEVTGGVFLRFPF